MTEQPESNLGDPDTALGFLARASAVLESSLAGLVVAVIDGADVNTTDPQGTVGWAVVDGTRLSGLVALLTRLNARGTFGDKSDRVSDLIRSVDKGTDGGPSLITLRNRNIHSWWGPRGQVSVRDFVRRGAESMQPVDPEEMVATAVGLTEASTAAVLLAVEIVVDAARK